LVRMAMFAEVASANVVAIVAIVAGAVVAFWIIRKIVKFILSLVIALLIAVAVIIYCVKAGYISQDDAEKLNPLNSEQVRQAAMDAGAWAGEQAKEAARKVVAAAVDEAVERAIPTNRPSR